MLSLGLKNSILSVYKKEIPFKPCHEAAVIHFQAFKSQFYSFTVNKIGLDTTGVLVTDSGLIPLQRPGEKSFEEMNPIALAYGSELLITTYCHSFAVDFKRCHCSIHHQKDIVVVRLSSMKKSSASLHRITLIVQCSLLQLLQLLSNYHPFLDWSFGPILVVVFGVNNLVLKQIQSSINILPKKNEMTFIFVNSSHCEDISHASSDNLPSYMMSNIALDYAKTDLVCMIYSFYIDIDISMILNKISNQISTNVLVDLSKSEKQQTSNTMYILETHIDSHKTTLPVAIFNRSTYHSKFVRFPEELYSPFCDFLLVSYSLSIYDIFEGLGYPSIKYIPKQDVVQSVRNQQLIVLSSHLLKNRYTSQNLTFFNNSDIIIQCKKLLKHEHLLKFSNIVTRSVYFTYLILYFFYCDTF